MNRHFKTTVLTVICICGAVGCRIAGHPHGAANVNSEPAVVRVGMSFDEARTMLDRLRAEDVTALVNLPREVLGPFDRLFCYRLRSGIVIQLYCGPGEKGLKIYRIAASTDKIGPLDASKVPERMETQLDLHLVGVPQFNLGNEKSTNP